MSCKLMRPIVDGLQKRYQGRLDIKILSFADPKARAQVERYGVDGHPAFIFLGRDGRLAQLILGEAEPAELTAIADRLTAAP